MYVQKYCRFCAELKTNEDLLDLELFPFLYEEIKVELNVLDVGSEIDMSSLDSLPKTVCTSCHNALVQAHKFVMKLRSSQYALKMIFSAKLKEAEVHEVYAPGISDRNSKNECDTINNQQEYEGIKSENECGIINDQQEYDGINSENECARNQDQQENEGIKSENECDTINDQQENEGINSENECDTIQDQQENEGINSENECDTIQDQQENEGINSENECETNQDQQENEGIKSENECDTINDQQENEGINSENECETNQDQQENQGTNSENECDTINDQQENEGINSENECDTINNQEEYEGSNSENECDTSKDQQENEGINSENEHGTINDQQEYEGINSENECDTINNQQGNEGINSENEYEDQPENEGINSENEHDTINDQQEYEGINSENECDTSKDQQENEGINSENECDTITEESPFEGDEGDSVKDKESINRPLDETLDRITEESPLLLAMLTNRVTDKKSINNTSNNMGAQLYLRAYTSDISTLDVSWTTYECICLYCEERLPNINALREHCREDHDRLCCAYKCADCKTEFKFFQKFVNHVIGHRASLRKYCPYCNITLEPSTNTNHVGNHRSKDNTCDHCGKIFDSKDYLEQHKRDNYYNNWDIMETEFGKIKKKPKVASACKLQSIKDESWNGYPWTCQICNHEFGELLLLRAHIKEVHGKCFAMKCVDCDVVMECYRHFAHHVRKHRRFLKRYCHYCNYQFKEDETEWDHISQHFAHEDRVCDGCGEILPDGRAYWQHVSTYQPTKSRKTPLERYRRVANFKCDICQRVLRTLNNFRLHQINVHKKRKREEPAQCDQCGETFYYAFELRNHVKTTHKERSEICKICNRGFRTASSLRSHHKTHSELKYQCDLCKRRFRKKRNVAVHLQGVHAEEKKFQCPVCGKTFAFPEYLRRHELLHTGVKPYSCPDCGRQFTNWGNCNKHMKRIHGTTLAKILKPIFSKF